MNFIESIHLLISFYLLLGGYVIPNKYLPVYLLSIPYIIIDWNDKDGLCWITKLTNMIKYKELNFYFPYFSRLRLVHNNGLLLCQVRSRPRRKVPRYLPSRPHCATTTCRNCPPASDPPKAIMCFSYQI